MLVTFEITKEQYGVQDIDDLCKEDSKIKFKKLSQTTCSLEFDVDSTLCMRYKEVYQKLRCMGATITCVTIRMTMPESKGFYSRLIKNNQAIFQLDYVSLGKAERINLTFSTTIRDVESVISFVNKSYSESQKSNHKLFGLF